MVRDWLQQRRVNIFLTFSILLSLLLGSPAQGKRGQGESFVQSTPYHSFIVAQTVEEEESTEAEADEVSIDDRRIFLTGKITYKTAESIVSQLLKLDAENPEEDIYLYISSPGGSVYAGMAIYDAMQYVQADVVTVSIGYSASMASFLLAAGTPGKRYAFPHTRVMIHRPFGGAFGEAEDLEIRARESQLLTNQFYQLFSLHTGQSIRQIQRDTERDYFMSASEAVDYGIVDQIMERELVVEE